MTDSLTVTVTVTDATRRAAICGGRADTALALANIATAVKRAVEAEAAADLIEVDIKFHGPDRSLARRMRACP